MRFIYICALIIMSAGLIVGCASSMTPNEFNEKFPKATMSQYFDHSTARDAIAFGKCKLLVAGRKYTSPIGFTVVGDVDNGAEGVDQWVKVDNGNAYTINNFEWISVGNKGVTQLIIYFDTMLCEY
jgi:hypothetical protein